MNCTPRELEFLNQEFAINPDHAFLRLLAKRVLGVSIFEVDDIATRAHLLLKDFSPPSNLDTDRDRLKWAMEVCKVIAQLAGNCEIAVALHKGCVAIEERDRGFGDIDEPLYRPVPTSNHLEPRRVRQMKSMSAFAYQTLSRLNVDAAAKKVAAVARKYLPTPPHRIDKNPIGEKTIRNWMKRRATGQLPVSFDDGDPFRDVYHYRPEVRAKLVLDRLERVLKALKAQID